MPKKNIFSSYNPEEIDKKEVAFQEEYLEEEDFFEIEEEKEENIEIEEEIDLSDPYNLFLSRIDEITNRIYKGEVSQFITFDKGMHPTCKYNKSILQVIYNDRIKRGDIILLKTSAGYSIKRVIKFVKNGILLLGDNEKQYLLVSDREQIIGKIVGKIENSKYISFNSTKQKKKAQKKFIRFAWWRTKGRVLNDFIDKEVVPDQLAPHITEEQISDEMKESFVQHNEELKEIDFLEEK